ncbi:dimethylsulfonioproprionate lyase family protein [Paraburkholderia azotifigens]|uniref:Dimethylsulfonioproprionate lyase family protein n=1 Tax=Paraburkholderia azotifigens TaxID=2057004 RepID=A0A5C6V5K3_9BURK|nr:dimethylsulfonioproprionate lyase family protein [Paraburkholderia azotifigens]TXC79736.1 transcriptional regulator [Paraburkholderia azotifigens]
MTTRPEVLTDFIHVVRLLFASDRLPLEGRKIAEQVFARLDEPSDDGQRASAHYPACDWLDASLVPLDEDVRFRDIAKALKAVAPLLGWRRRTSGPHGSAGYVEQHANGIICGPGGAESRRDVQLGLTIMLPHTRYPDHSHPPEEAYVLLSPGEFRQGDGEWADPGLGGGIFNTPNIVHAMRSDASPFLALWCLLV